MSTLLAFLKMPQNRGIFFWIKFYWNEFLKGLYSKKVKSPKYDWKGIKTSHTYTPEGWSKENCFEFLGKEYSGRVMKRFMDKP